MTEQMLYDTSADSVDLSKILGCKPNEVVDGINPQQLKKVIQHIITNPITGKVVNITPFHYEYGVRHYLIIYTA